jgi:hypothetical protein
MPKLCAFAGGLVVLFAIVAYGHLAASPSEPASPTAVPVSSRQFYMGQGVDTLDPLPPGVTPKMSVSAVLTALRANPETGRYVADSSQLTILVGLYNNPTLRDSRGAPVQNVIVYVITGGLATCGPPVGPPRPASQPRVGSGTCRGTIVVDSTSGEPLLLREAGMGQP